MYTSLLSRARSSAVRLLMCLGLIASVGAANINVASAATQTGEALPTPSTWVANVGGVPSLLGIYSIDGAGHLCGWIIVNTRPPEGAQEPISGFWDPFAGKISFQRNVHCDNTTHSTPSASETFTGYVSRDGHLVNDYDLYMAGTFEALPGSGIGTQEKSTFEWSAGYRVSATGTARPFGFVQSTLNFEPWPATAWSINANASIGPLNVLVDPASGIVSGTMYGDPITGIYDGYAKKLTFVRAISGAGPFGWQTFTGYLSQQPTLCGGLPSTNYLAGEFQVFANGGGVAEQNAFGWYAKANCS